MNTAIEMSALQARLLTDNEPESPLPEYSRLVQAIRVNLKPEVIKPIATRDLILFSCIAPVVYMGYYYLNISGPVPPQIYFAIMGGLINSYFYFLASKDCINDLSDRTYPPSVLSKIALLFIPIGFMATMACMHLYSGFYEGVIAQGSDYNWWKMAANTGFLALNISLYTYTMLEPFLSPGLRCCQRNSQSYLKHERKHLQHVLTEIRFINNKNLLSRTNQRVLQTLDLSSFEACQHSINNLAKAPELAQIGFRRALSTFSFLLAFSEIMATTAMMMDASNPGIGLSFYGEIFSKWYIAMLFNSPNSYFDFFYAKQYADRSLYSFPARLISEVSESAPANRFKAALKNLIFAAILYGINASTVFAVVFMTITGANLIQRPEHFSLAHAYEWLLFPKLVTFFAVMVAIESFVLNGKPLIEATYHIGNRLSCLNSVSPTADNQEKRAEAKMLSMLSDVIAAPNKEEFHAARTVWLNSLQVSNHQAGELILN
ncbi:MAG: hypothetical protein K0S29_619 [Gammaproteobacteria bacterium]|jgi:hypothetical protein|nr:hypothetical protein [Gammaproteobacteria bacterium]